MSRAMESGAMGSDFPDLLYRATNEPKQNVMRRQKGHPRRTGTPV